METESPTALNRRFGKRNDKYDICAKVNINDAGEDEVYRMMRDYEAVIIWDLPAAIRNRFVLEAACAGNFTSKRKDSQC